MITRTKNILRDCFRIRPVILSATIGLAVAAIAAPSLGQTFEISAGDGPMQMGQRGMVAPEDAFKPQMSRDELKIMATELQLDDVQLDLITLAHDGYLAANDEASRPLRDQSGRQIMIGGPGTDFDREAMHKRIKEMRDIGKTYRAEQKRLEDDFKAMVQGLLSPKQSVRWERYEQGFRRRSTLSQQSAIGGEGVDVFKLVDDLELNASRRSSIQAILSGYSEEMDAALQSRNRVLESLSGTFENMEIGRPQDGSGEQAGKILEQATQKRFALVRLNEKYVSLLTDALGSEYGGRLHDDFVHASFSAIFRPTKADRYIARLENDEYLTTIQTQTIDQVIRGYESSLTDVNGRLVDLERQRQIEMNNRTLGSEDDQEGVRMRTQTVFEGAGGGMTVMGNSHGSPETEARIKETKGHKKDMVKATIESLFAALSTEQQEQYPKPKPPKRFTLGGGDVDFGNMEPPEGMDPEQWEKMMADLMENLELEVGEGGDVQIQTFTTEDGEEAVAIAIMVEDDGEEGDEEEGDDGK